MKSFDSIVTNKGIIHKDPAMSMNYELCHCGLAFFDEVEHLHATDIIYFMSKFLCGRCMYWIVTDWLVLPMQFAL